MCIDVQVKALVELITSLMCITPSSSGPRSPAASANDQEMMRAMVEAGVRKALLQVLRGLDTDHPKAGASSPITAQQLLCSSLISMSIPTISLLQDSMLPL